MNMTNLEGKSPTLNGSTLMNNTSQVSAPQSTSFGHTAHRVDLGTEADCADKCLLCALRIAQYARSL
jgi:hypothetical protein